MAFKDRIIKKAARVFDKIRKRAFDANIRFFLLKRLNNSGKFVSVGEVFSGWYVEFNEYRGQMVFEIATNEVGFVDTISQTSYVGYGVPDADNDLEVFSIDPDRRDVIPPNGDSPFWKVYGTKVPLERFKVV